MTSSPKSLLVVSRPDSPQLKYLSQLSDRAEIKVGNAAEVLAEQAKRAEVLLIWDGNQKLLSELFPICPALKWVHSKNAGIEPLLFPDFIRSDVVLTNSRGVYAQSLSEFAIAGMLYFAKDFPRLLQNKAAHNWQQFPVEELAGKTLGIVGYGEIGRQVAERAKAFKMKVLALRRNPQNSAGDPFIDQIFGLSGLDPVLRQSDYLVLAAPGTKETIGLIGEAQFRLMKQNAVLVNIGRGSITDEAALIRVLKEKRIRGAALDVFATEPLPSENELWSLPNVFISPHSADQTETWLDEAMEFFLTNFDRYVSGEPLRNVCDKALGY